MTATAQNPTSEPVGVFLRRIASELVQLSGITDRLQDLTEELAAHGGAKHHTTIQELDWLHQHLIEIAQLLDVISESASDRWHIEARSLTGNVRLARLYNQLHGIGCYDANRSDDNIEFF